MKLKKTLAVVVVCLTLLFTTVMSADAAGKITFNFGIGNAGYSINVYDSEDNYLDSVSLNERGRGAMKISADKDYKLVFVKNEGDDNTPDVYAEGEEPPVEKKGSKKDAAKSNNQTQTPETEEKKDYKSLIFFGVGIILCVVLFIFDKKKKTVATEEDNSSEEI